MDPRRNFPQDPEPRWYQDDDPGQPGETRGHGDPSGEWLRRGEARHSDAYRLPGPRGGSVARPYVDQGYGDSYESPSQSHHAAADGARLGSTGEMSLDEALGGRPPVASHATEAMDRSHLRRESPVSAPPLTAPAAPPTAPSVAGPTTAIPTVTPPGAPAKTPELGRGVYRSRRPAQAAALVALTVVFELPALRIFFASAFASKADPRGTISSMFLILGLPMFAMGLYGLITGAAAAAAGSRTWLRTPLAYLPLAVVLFFAAALAA